MSALLCKSSSRAESDSYAILDYFAKLAEDTYINSGFQSEMFLK